jgi:hypothetical protein
MIGSSSRRIHAGSPDAAISVERNTPVVASKAGGEVMRDSAFFEDVRQIDIMFDDQPAKSPMFYYDGSMINASFPARYGRLRELMPDARYVPARLAPGLGVVTITCMENRDTDVGPYREVPIAISLSEPYFRANLPGRALMSARRLGQVHTFIPHMPVTTEFAVRVAADLYAPGVKLLAEIDFSETDEQSRCRVAEGEEHVFTLLGKRIPTPRSQRFDSFAHFFGDGQPVTAQFKANHLEYGESLRRGVAVLELGERHPIALELRRLLVSRKSLYYEYVPRFEAMLFGPEHQTPLLAQRWSQAMEDALQHQLSG